MERSLTVEDKIRRAEEIYYRKRNQSDIKKDIIEKTPKKNKKFKVIRKIIKQMIVCLVIYGIFYLVVNNEFVFSEDFRNRTKELLSQDINIKNIYITLSNKVNEIYSQITNKQETDDEKITENLNDNQNQDEQNIENEQNIGGAEEILEVSENSNVENTGNIENTDELTQMQKDANYLKSVINFVKPVEGNISSAFGWRNPTTATVPKDHKGTDISAETGTKIIASTEGTVILSSSKGDYGKHLKIQLDEMIIVYAHCNKLYVKEGEYIKQGQEIAEVGATGNATGPHLHFEIRYQNRYVDPQLVLDL